VKRVIIHTDGGCSGNPGPGGWGVVIEYGPHRRELSGGEPATTNNRMELRAAVEALRALKEPCAVEFHTDSQYLRQGITGWVAGWKRNGWKTADKQPVKNRDLWEALDAEAARHEVEWHWVRGHADSAGNQRADQLATAAIKKIRGQHGAALKPAAKPAADDGPPPW
jgi:ribonuclease HI